MEVAPTLGRIFGRVMDAGTGQGLARVDVTLASGATHRATTGPDGRFTMPGLPPGQVDVTFSLVGYASRTTTVVIEAGGAFEVRAPLSTQAIELAPIEVTVGSGYLERSGFYRRSGLLTGSQWTRRDLDDFDPATVADVLVRAPGVNVIAGRGAARAMSARPGNAPGQDDCRLRLYLDGVATYDWDLDWIRVEDLEAIEVYHGPSTPIEYRGLVDPDGVYPCGVVLIWSRRDE
jgi:hypothetical protein